MRYRFKPRFFLIAGVFILTLALSVFWILSRDGASETPPGGDPPAIGSSEADPMAGLPKSTTDMSSYPLSSFSDDVLVLVNKIHRVTAEYKPDDLVKVNSADANIGTEETRTLRKPAAEALEALVAGAEGSSYTLVMRTGYRSYEYQEKLFADYAKANGEEKANQFSAKAGESEHQTGLSCDMGIPGKGLTAFTGTEEAKWLAENCWKYGFIVRFPSDKTDITGYTYESWHIRYVGVEAAEYMYSNNLTLEEYLGVTD